MNAARNTVGEPAPAPPPTILIVEDDVLVRSLVATYLRDSGFHVIEANGADEAIRFLQAELTVDIVFSDIQMPGSMDGLGLAQWMRRERPWLEIILTSGAARTTQEAGPILAKPYDYAELERHIRSLLAR
jgi:CheY-like chemotaxis protein